MYQTAGQLFKLNRNKFQKKIASVRRNLTDTTTPTSSNEETLVVVERFTSANEECGSTPSGVKRLLKTVESSDVKKEKQNNADIYYLRDPTVWGPIFWFSLHNGAAKYPENPSNHIKEKIKGFIMGIPYMLPCETCSEHAKDFIEKNKDRLDAIVKDKDSYFKFTHEFHNNVNDIVGNEKISLEEAKKIYYDDL